MRKIPRLAGLLAAAVALPFAAAPGQSPSTAPTSSLQSRLRRDYRRLPLRFEPNVGQTDAQVKFLSRAPGYSVFLTPGEAVLSLVHHHPRHTASPVSSDASYPANSELPIHDVLRMRMLGSDSHGSVRGMEELPGKTNYFRGNDPRDWHTGVSSFAKVSFGSVYPGVDMLYSGDDGQLEFSFVVAPHADPHAIVLDFAGAHKLAVDARTGDLVLKLGREDVRFHKPLAYELETSASQPPQRHLVAADYVVDAHRRLTLKLAPYDRSKTLIIDPVLNYSTYLGGSNDDYGNSIAVDSAGNAYVTGYTDSTDFPTTSGAFQTTCAGACKSTSDAFVTKLDPTGSALIYSTYLGGTGNDYGNGIALDPAGDAYIVGQTFSTNFPITSGAFQTTCGGGCSGGNVFVTELNPTGSALVYSTYLGGVGKNQGNGIVLDSSLNAYITGYTVSTSFPVTAGAFQTTCDCSTLSDAFVTKLNPTGSALVFSTYLGGSGADVGYSIALDPSDNPYVTGYTASNDFPTTAGAFQTQLSATKAAFVTALDSTGSALRYSTYLGGSSTLTTVCEACGTSIAVNSSGNAYVSGLTAETTFPVTPGAFQTTLKSSTKGHNAFIAELNPGGTALLFSTYLGGSADTGSTGIAIDPSGNVWLKGNTMATDFPVTAGAFQTVEGGNFDAWVAELNPTGSALLYSTYLGGSGDEFGGATNPLAIDSGNPPNVYVTGYTDSTNYPSLPGGFQTTQKGINNAFVAWFAPSANVGLSSSTVNFGNQQVGMTSSPQTVTLTNTGNLDLTPPVFLWTGPNQSDFAETNTCASAIAPQTNCSIKLTFTPTASGAESASLSITDNAPGSPQTISLTGTGVSGGPIVTLSPTKLTFPATVLKTSSPRQSVTLTNTGSQPLLLTSLTISGDFSQTNTCGSTINAGDTCLIGVTFTPTLPNTRTGTVTITDNAANSPQTISLTGVGTAMRLSPSSLNFGTVSVGSSSSPQLVTVTNTGSTYVSLQEITFAGQDPGDYSQTNNCLPNIAAGTRCSITVTFTPTATGSRPADLSLTDNGGGSPQLVPLSGTGQ